MDQPAAQNQSQPGAHDAPTGTPFTSATSVARQTAHGPWSGRLFVVLQVVPDGQQQDHGLDHQLVFNLMFMSDMPLLITPITRPPMTEPMMVPTPPAAGATNEHGRDGVQLKHVARPRHGLVHVGGEDHAGNGRHDPHDDKHIKLDPLGIDAREFGRFGVATNGK